jgi:hypothetical protein
MSIRSLLPAVLLSILAACLQGQDLGDTDRLGSGPDERPADAMVDDAVEGEVSAEVGPDAVGTEDAALFETSVDAASDVDVETTADGAAFVDGAADVPAETVTDTTGDTTPADAGARLLSLVIAPKELVLDEASETKPSVLATTAGGEIVDVTARASLSIADATVATIREGVVQAQAPGETRLEASVDGLRASATIRVRSATLLGITIYPQPTGAEQVVVVPFSGGLAFRAMGNFAHGGSRDLTKEVAWAINDPTVGSVETAAGEVRLLPKRREVDSKPGTGRLSASLRGITSDTGFRVQPAVKSLRFTTTTFAAPKDALPISLQAVPVYDDGWERSSDDVTYRTDRPSVIQISKIVREFPSSFVSWTITPLSVGSAELTASFAGVDSKRTFVVSNARLTALELSSDRVADYPLPAALPAGIGFPLVVYGTWDDGFRQDVTSVATLAASGRASIDGRRVDTDSVGEAKIQASLRGLSHSRSIRVVEFAFTATRAIPATVTCAAGTSFALVVESTMTSGDSIRPKALVNWNGIDQIWQSTSSSSTVAASPSQGRVSCKAPGQAQLKITPVVSGRTLPSVTVPVTVR